MTRCMRRNLFGMAALSFGALTARGQAPMVEIPIVGEAIQAQKLPDLKPMPKKGDQKPEKKEDKKPEKKEDPKPLPPVLPVVPDVPPVTLPATTAPIPSIPTAAASAAIVVTSLPPVYGDYIGTGGLYTPYLQATQPNGQVSNVLPGQTVSFPLGTTFNDPNIQTRIVRVQVGTQTIPAPALTPIVVPVSPPGTPAGTNPPATPVGNGTPPPTPTTPPPITPVRPAPTTPSVPPITPGTPTVVPIFEDRVVVVGPAAQGSRGAIPVNVARGAFIIAENESPRPADRFYVTYNYFSDVNPSLNVPGLPTTNVNRETFGLEKTFLQGDASIGLRLPLLQLSGPYNVESQVVGDLSVVFKYALVNDWIRNDDGSLSPGNVLSAGLVVTAPTGGTGSYSSLSPDIHSTLLQPWVGGILVRGKGYVQGFSSIAVPTDSRDTTYIFNSVQAGYVLYTAPRGSSNFLTSFTPTVEAHVSTPLNNRGLLTSPVGAVDIVSLTGGFTLGLGKASYLNLGVNAPITGPVPYRVEALAQLNFFY